MKMNVKGNDNFRTPDHIFKQLDNIFNFTLDAACVVDDCKCPRGCLYDKGFNGLEMPWGGGSACSAIRRLVKRPPLSKRLMKKLLTEIVRLSLWCCRQTAKIARRFSNTSKRTSFMKPCQAVSLSLTRQRSNR